MLMRSPLVRDRRRPPGFIPPCQPVVAEKASRETARDLEDLRAPGHDGTLRASQNSRARPRACSPLACLACKLWQMTDMALPSVRGNVNYVRERGVVPGPKMMARTNNDGADQRRIVDCVHVPL